MMVAAAALGLVIGLVIGGLGGGGGVLTVPVLVYVLGLSAQDATTSSVIIVGTSAVVGALARIRCRGIEWRTAIGFGVVGIPAAYLGTLMNHHAGQSLLLLVFAAITLVAAVAMVLTGDNRGDDVGVGAAAAAGLERGGRTGTALAVRPVAGRTSVSSLTFVSCAIVAGFLTGFLGVGGGFLVVPALVIVLRMPMSTAVGTSLMIIVLNAASSMVARIGAIDLDYRVVVPFTVAAVVGTILGKRIADRFSGVALTRAFAVMLALVGLFVGAQSLLTL
jgi:uncharacterized protein